MMPIIADGKIKGVKVTLILHALASQTLEGVAAKYGLEREDVEAVLAYAVACCQARE